jgi:PAS domain S-box-containing protein
LLVHTLRDDIAAPTLVATLVALLTMAVCNLVTVTAVLWIASGRTPRVPEQRREMLLGFAGRVVSSGAGIATGICLSALFLWNHWLILLGALFVIGIDAAGRANAALRADHARLEGMQRATHTLGAALDVNKGLQQFLADVRLGFEVQGVELVLFSERGATVYACSDRSETVEAICVDTHPLAEAIASKIVAPGRFVAGDGSTVGTLLAATRHARVLAAPLRTAGNTIGVLFLFDRLGIEGFERGELKIADALASEVVGFLERATLLQAIDDERRKLADILGNTSDGIFSIAADGTITSWNAGLATMTGYVADEIVGTRHFGMLRPRDSIGRDVLIERWVELAETPGALPTDLQIVSASGDTVWLSCSYSRIPDGASSGDVLVVVARNVTQARELERLKDDFVAVVSHELRTPLVPIKGWAQTLLNRGDRLNEDQRRTAVQSILSQAQKLESLVLNILEASRIEAGRVDNEGVADVVSITARIVEDTLSSRPDRQIRLRPPAVPCQVKGSAVWVERAVSNLVANAIKYSPDEEPVDVVIAGEGDDVTVSVTDRGPGIAAEAQERIFDRFERLEETRKQTGTGLGLYITRRLARAMGGDVTVSSVPGAGSTFLLRLPMAAVAATPMVMPEQRPSEKAVGDNGDNVVRLH